MEREKLEGTISQLKLMEAELRKIKNDYFEAVGQAVNTFGRWDADERMCELGGALFSRESINYGLVDVTHRLEMLLMKMEEK